MSGASDTSETIAWEAPSAAVPLAPESEGGAAELIDQHPEALAGAAFVGGLLAAMIVRRLGR